MPTPRVMTARRSAWRVATIEPQGGGTVAGTRTVVFAPGDAPVALVVGESVEVRLHALGEGALGLLGLRPIAGRLSRDELAGLVPRTGPTADDGALHALPDPFHALAPVAVDDRLFVPGLDGMANAYAFRGHDFTLEGAIAFDAVEAHAVRTPDDVLGACAADPLEGAFLERLHGRPIASPIFVLVHPWSARSLSFVAARAARYVAPLADGARLLAALHQLDGGFDQRVVGCEVVLGAAEATVIATLQGGGRHEVGRIPFATATTRDEAIAFGMAVDAILDPAG